MTTLLDRSFFQRPAPAVAPDLLGKLLLVQHGQESLGGIILEVEAYQGEEDLACHARSGKTARTWVMYDQAGYSYVYFTYGMHWMLNVVCDQLEEPAAVLIRAIHPLYGLETIADRRQPQPQARWCDGPAKLCQALGINGGDNHQDLCAAQSRIQIHQGVQIPQNLIQRSPRIGIQYVPEPWLTMPWRFFLPKNQISPLTQALTH